MKLPWKEVGLPLRMSMVGGRGSAVGRLILLGAVGDWYMTSLLRTGLGGKHQRGEGKRKERWRSRAGRLQCAPPGRSFWDARFWLEPYWVHTSREEIQ